MFAGHDKPLELIDHVGQQVERLGVLLHAVCDHLVCCHNLLAQMANILSAMLDAGPELLHTVLFGKIRRMTGDWLALVLTFIAVRSSREVDHRGMT